MNGNRKNAIFPGKGERRLTRLCLVAGSLAIATVFFSGSAQAANTRIPAAFYPTGAHIWYSASISNAQMDCQWGFFCEGPVPLFHFQTQDALHRLSGWGQSAGWHGHHRSMQFVVYSSHYPAGTNLEGLSWSRAALEDLIYATRASHYRALAQAPRLLPAAQKGQSLTELQRSGTEDLVVMACASGTQEVEGLVVFDHRSVTARRIALHDLGQQVKMAIAS
jgi:hypothetical protein